MNKKQNVFIIASLLSTLALSGCASNDAIIAQQKQHAEQITVLAETVDSLGETVNALESQLITQQGINADIAQDVGQLYVERDELAQIAAATYTVIQGDTLSGIAAANDISLEKLIQLNPQISNPNLLLIGHIINIK